MALIGGVLIDLGGVVYQGRAALPGSIEAIERLKADGIATRFLTNTTSIPQSAILARLQSFGLPVSREELFTPAVAARAYIVAHDLRPHYLMCPELLEDFRGMAKGKRPAVVIADAGDGFTYASLNDAFRRLDAGAEFIALASNRVFVNDDGELSLDVGAFVAALEYATGRTATILDKPSAEFFHLAVADMGLLPGEVAMIGDDAEFDVAAARAAGLFGFLVKTGKWTPGSAERLNLPPEIEFDDFAAVVSALLAMSAT